MVPRPLYCASLALSPSRGGNAPADTTNIETTTATPANRDTAERADFSRFISLPPRNPCSPTSRRTSRAALPHRLLTAPRNYAYLSLHALVCISARSSPRLSLVSTSPGFARRLVSISASQLLLLRCRPGSMLVARLSETAC